ASEVGAGSAAEWEIKLWITCIELNSGIHNTQTQFLRLATLARERDSRQQRSLSGFERLDIHILNSPKGPKQEGENVDFTAAAQPCRTRSPPYPHRAGSPRSLPAAPQQHEQGAQ